MSKKTDKEVKDTKEKYTVVKHGSLTLVNTPTVKTFYMNGSIDHPTLTKFQKFLEDTCTENNKIDTEETERKEKDEFKKIHDPESKPEFVPAKRKVERINLVINSGGGLVAVMLEVVALMKTSPIPIDTYCFGSAMSAAFFIFLHGKRRFVGEGASFMTHSIGAMAWDNVPNMTIRMEYLVKQNEYAQQEIAKRTGIPLEKLKEKEHLDWYLTAEEALDVKIGEYLIRD
ncbi:putative ATP-dependent Clp protease proteolytic subunit [Erwinia phage pEa_SNUABM_50]|uniref:ATP-dependent Clp protease proteolytic subunit n=4 Tax=Eneladusvirus BF TaxID=2560751 RepID=A0A7L8ZP51_9CAUD|nr:head maturation protease [Serratia phage BF]QOI71388.1 putative ATP-dependent Clp protease proteolytic subunit [Erwinia phage pEa_SNUABM_12]QOI71930.1 ATP-dependent Clp protease proteolytic subunit [Erwinia phage pEa_SNUABM_47]QOI72470.1 putative ATP-dependent Clp protease proteolytic subunit [Erwinia phage pEa_SNUABM_50]QXO11597.1 hypothetical protein pEaSNUABM19_00467 [Erwinia phage pEa_SNUABM_19]QXO12145.1 hypothetical protein pEaSNUABM44_00465 [Erwinia phage pEa_SNUABM_44]QXO12699.1 hy